MVQLHRKHLTGQSIHPFIQVSTLQEMVERQQEMQDIGGPASGGDRKLAQDYMNLQQESERMKEHMEKLQVFLYFRINTLLYC